MGHSNGHIASRAHDARAQQEWKRYGRGPWDYAENGEVLRKFWTEGIRRNRKYESIVTLGMRGDGDLPMSAASNVALLKRIVSDQRKILADNVNPDLAAVPQLWALYKEVQDYYEKGMRVPDDVTLLWCDDNWGNIRRLPTAEESKRSGGAGVYYHFDYVGGPRSYKWLNTVPITKVWEQMNRLRARRKSDLDRKRGRSQAAGVSDRILFDVRLGATRLACRTAPPVHAALGGARVWTKPCRCDSRHS